jgi:Condensation domain/AMP-binding enzyme C-terminal domain
VAVVSAGGDPVPAPAALRAQALSLPPDQRRELVERLRGLSPPPGRPGRPRRIPATAAQVSQWYLWQLAPDSHAYHVAYLYDLHGPVAEADLGRALDGVVARHEALRTTFEPDRDGLWQVIGPPRPVLAAPEQVAGPDADARRRAARGRARAAAAVPFDLRAGPLYRAGLWRYDRDRYLLLLVFHHSVIDHRSAQIIASEIAALYTAADDQLLPARQLSSARPDRPADDCAALRYWSRRLDGLVPAAPPADLLGETPRRRPAARHTIGVDGTLLARLDGLGRELGATRCAVALAACWLFLARQTGSPEAAVGLPASGRGAADDGVVGFFVNTVVLRGRVGAGDSFRVLVQSARDALVQAIVHQDCPLAEVVRAVRPPAGRLFDVMFSYARDDGPPDQLRLRDVRVTQLDAVNDEAPFDLTVTVLDREAALTVHLDYAASRYLPGTVAGWGRAWRDLLAAVAAAPDEPVGRLLQASAAERQWLAARAQVLDAQGEPLPVGVVGELFAPGPGGGRAATGRLGRIRSDGWVEDHGALDEAGVPAGGGLVRLSRIEAVLGSVPGVKRAAAVLVADPAGRPVLTLYLVAAPGAALSRSALGTALAALLGPAAPPARFRRLPALPVTSSGEPDRAALARLLQPAGSGHNRRLTGGA